MAPRLVAQPLCCATTLILTYMEFFLKVLIANKFFYRAGGAEAVMFQEREFLLSQGIEVVDFAMQDRRNEPSSYADSFVAQQDYRNNNLSMLEKFQSAVKFIHSSEAVEKFRRLLISSQPDLVHCHNIYHQLTPSIINVAKSLNVPVVLTLHDYKPICPVYNRLRHGTPCSDCRGGNFRSVLKNRCADDSFGRSALMYAEATVQRLMGSYESVDHVIAPSQFMADAVIGERFSEEQTSVIYNGVDLPSPTGHPADDRQDQNYILFFGRLAAEKGISTLMEAHAEMADTKLVVAGTGPLEEQLRKQYPNAEYRGFVAGEALAATIAGAAVVVVPSEWYENCPMSVLEAMAHGRPVIGSRMGGIPELISEGSSGELFEAGNRTELKRKLVALMADPQRRLRYGEDAIDRVQSQFSVAVHNQKLMSLYEQVLA